MLRYKTETRSGLVAL